MNIEIGHNRLTAQVNLSGMIAFVAVINAASYTGAARQLGTSKSVVSRRISDMELSLRTRLIDRINGKVNVTEAGGAYYERCVTILESIEAANELMAGFNGGIWGRLRVSVPQLYGLYVLSPLLNEFAAIHSSLRIDIGVAERDALCNDMNYDMCIQIGQPPNFAMIAKTLTESRSWICASPAYLAAKGTPTSPEDLEHHDCLVSSAGSVSGGWQLYADGALKKFHVRERVRSACCLQLLEASRSGLGLALLPDYAIASAISSGELKTVMTEYAPPTNPISVVYPPSRRSSQKVRALVGFLAERIDRATITLQPA
jgi:DNA-binding transcriptional LysR family regulator